MTPYLKDTLRNMATPLSILYSWCNDFPIAWVDERQAIYQLVQPVTADVVENYLAQAKLPYSRVNMNEVELQWQSQTAHFDCVKHTVHVSLQRDADSLNRFFELAKAYSKTAQFTLFGVTSPMSFDEGCMALETLCGVKPHLLTLNNGATVASAQYQFDLLGLAPLTDGIIVNALIMETYYAHYPQTKSQDGFDYYAVQ